jgi:hypothetical protein
MNLKLNLPKAFNIQIPKEILKFGKSKKKIQKCQEPKIPKELRAKTLQMLNNLRCLNILLISGKNFVLGSVLLIFSDQELWMRFYLKSTQANNFSTYDLLQSSASML